MAYFGNFIRHLRNLGKSSYIKCMPKKLCLTCHKNLFFFGWFQYTALPKIRFREVDLSLNSINFMLCWWRDLKWYTSTTFESGWCWLKLYKITHCLKAFHFWHYLGKKYASFIANKVFWSVFFLFFVCSFSKVQQ